MVDALQPYTKWVNGLNRMVRIHLDQNKTFYSNKNNILKPKRFRIKGEEKRSLLRDIETVQ